MVPALAFIVTIMAVVPHVSHAQPPTTDALSPTPPKLSQCDCHVEADQSLPEATIKTVDAAELRRQFLQILQSRRSAEVPLSVEPAEHVDHPLYQDSAIPYANTSILSCANGTNFTTLQDLLHEENFYLITEAGEQGRVPVLILSLKQDSPRKRPAVVFLHGTAANKESLRPMLEDYASGGYISVAIDSRYHGLRAKNRSTYQEAIDHPIESDLHLHGVVHGFNIHHEALVSSWKKGDTMPFIFDTAWDLIKLADYLTQREDIDHDRIGITGISLGGMHAWFGGFVDTRYSVVVPVIGVQGFRWAIDNKMWVDRVKSICPVFDAARQDLNKTVIDNEVVAKVWDRIAPGVDSNFDSPYTIPAISPRPLLIVSGELDPRCPIQGLSTAISRATEAYREANIPGNFQNFTEKGVKHEFNTEMVRKTCDWFDRFFKM